MASNPWVEGIEAIVRSSVQNFIVPEKPCLPGTKTPRY
jgi:hypothetical protein